MIGRPSFRVANARDFYDYLKRKNPACVAHLRAKVPPATLAMLEHGVRADWAPVELDGPYVIAVVRYLGHEGARDTWRAFSRQTLVNSALLRSVVDSFVRLFGVSVGALTRALPDALRQSQRDVLTTSLTFGPRVATFVLRDIAAEVAFHYPEYATVLEGVFLSLYDVAHTPPQLEFESDLSNLKITARFHW